MKIIFTLISCLFLTIVQSQELKTIELLPPESKEYKDLAFLKNELQGKQLVMLGEQTHMYGNIFEMKARVLEYLHQELGFTTIAIESSMYDIWKMNKNGFNPKEFNKATWGVWSNTLEFQRVVNYIEKNNLKVIGFDSQVNNASQFVEDFYDYLPTKTRGNEKQLRELTNIGKEYDFIIFAVYKISIQDKRRKRNARFIGIAKNFILVQYENLPDSFWQP